MAPNSFKRKFEKEELGMSAEKNEALVRRLFEEVWNKGDLSAAKEVVHEDYTSPKGPFWDEARGEMTEAGLETLKEEMKSYRETYSDLRFELGRTFCEKDLVIATWRANGIVKGEFFTNRAGQKEPVELNGTEGMSMSRIADGKIVENRLYWPG
jgi:ketosteroid isomerase-like protein